MPAEPRGSVFETRNGYGIRWPEDGKRPQQTGFKTRTEARRWFADHVAPRLRGGGPDPSITFDRFCDLFLERHGATVAPRTKETLEERLARRARRSATGRSPSSKGRPPTLLAGARHCRTRRATG